MSPATKGTPSPADLVAPHPGRFGAQADVPAVQHHSLGRSNLYRSGAGPGRISAEEAKLRHPAAANRTSA